MPGPKLVCIGSKVCGCKNYTLRYASFILKAMPKDWDVDVHLPFSCILNILKDGCVGGQCEG